MFFLHHTGTRAAVTACAPAASSAPTELAVFAAASLLEPFKEIGEQFERQHPEAAVTFNFAASNQLVQQMASGAQADVFASANLAQMLAAEKSGRVTAGQARIFASNRLVAIYPRDNPAHLNSLFDLARPGVRLVITAKEAPVGQYTLDFLDKAAQNPAYGAAYRQAVLGNIVSLEANVKSVVGKVALGEADGGIVYSSDLAGTGGEKLGKLDIPDALNVVAVYPIAVVSDLPAPALAQAFVAAVLSPEGQAVLSKYHFLPPTP